MAGPHENLEHAEHAEHAARSNKKIALQIPVLALFLAFSETLGKSAQTTAIADNIKASDTWNFFQAKTIRQTRLRTAADVLSVQLPSVTSEESKGGNGQANRDLAQHRDPLRIRSEGKGWPQGATGSG